DNWQGWQRARRTAERAEPFGALRLHWLSRPLSDRITAVPLAFPITRPSRSLDPTACRPTLEGAGGQGRSRSRATVAARAAPCLSHHSAGSRRRPAPRAADAGPRRHRQNADLPARPQRSAAQVGGNGAPACPPQMIRHFLDFERPIAELEGKIDE